LVSGGSQGAHQINQLMMEAAPRLDPLGIEIVHQTGEADRELVETSYRAAGLRAEVVAFEPDMPSRYRWADLALCRSGALTVAELALAGLPALLIPYPYAADDHQRANAAALVAAGAARLLDDQSLDGGCVIKSLQDLFASPERLAAMSASAVKLARPDAAARIIEDCSNRAGR
jgi:UDP-N-acetylglucosamine--N-acetylmuramyl-(pentapeptide) pyrophosphoryl-undecaprenol N-acetylglucosamine transferase